MAFGWLQLTDHQCTSPDVGSNSWEAWDGRGWEEVCLQCSRADPAELPTPTALLLGGDAMGIPEADESRGYFRIIPGKE